MDVLGLRRFLRLAAESTDGTTISSYLAPRGTSKVGIVCIHGTNCRFSWQDVLEIGLEALKMAPKPRFQMVSAYVRAHLR